MRRLVNDFSDEALELYRRRAKIADAAGSTEFKRRLLQQGLLKEEKAGLIPTGFGVLLFGKEPRRAVRQAGLLASIQYPNGDREREEFDKPAVLIPDLLEKWLRDRLPNVFDRNRMQREQRPALPFEMVREAVVNALIHRDYGIEGAKCQIAVDEDTIVVRSPGGPTPPISLEQMQNFSAPMLSRNPALHFVFARMGMAEEQGIGLGSLKNRSSELALPLPRFTLANPYLVLTLFRTKQAAIAILGKDAAKELNRSEQTGWEWLTMSPTPISAQEYAAAMKLSKRMANYHLKHFVEMGLLDPIEAGPQTRFRVLQK